MKKAFVILFILLSISGCKKTPDIPAGDLGGGQIFDPSTYNPAKYLVSVSNPTPDATQAQVPVIIACHGYGATTFEWDEFRAWSAGRTDYSISQVLLDGHGVTYDQFKNSTWHDWQSSIVNEYTKLVQEGYKNIDLVGSSTSCTLILDLLHSGFFNNTATTVHIFFVDPIIIPSDKFLSVVGVVGPMLGYVESDGAPGEEKYYYHYRPQETLQQLDDVLDVVRGELQDGITLPKNVYLKVYKSIRDPTADPVSVVLVYNGTHTSTGGNIDLDMIDGDIHVFTRLDLVPGVTAQDQANQVYAFNDITMRIK